LVVAVDPRASALAGHSLGGYTVLGPRGGWESWKRSDIKGRAGLSPFTDRSSATGALDRVEAAVDRIRAAPAICS